VLAHAPQQISEVWAEVERGGGAGGGAGAPPDHGMVTPEDPAFAALISSFAKSVVHKVRRHCLVVAASHHEQR
jgi:hypothetical protein